MRVKVTLFLGLAVLAVLNYQIYRKESLIKSSEEIFLELAPVDPRSLMQGDYMALEYKIANEMRRKLRDQGGVSQNSIAVVSLNNKRIASYKRLWAGQSLEAAERIMTYPFGVDSFFFEEGQGKRYENARYGIFLLDKKGRTILRALADENQVRIEPEPAS